MGSILFWVGALIVVSVLSPVLRLVIAAVAGKQIGDAALAQQPDTITLDRQDSNVWKNANGVRRIVDTLRAQEFQDAGVYRVKEMPGLHVQLLAQPSGGFYAAVYEHPKAGVWMDLATLYPDDTSSTFTNCRPTGLSPRPGHPVVNVHGSEPIDVLTRARRERPKQVFVPVSTGQAVAVFEKAYAEAMAYRRSVGVSRKEVMNVAMKKAA